MYLNAMLKPNMLQASGLEAGVQPLAQLLAALHPLLALILQGLQPQACPPIIHSHLLCNQIPFHLLCSVHDMRRFAEVQPQERPWLGLQGLWPWGCPPFIHAHLLRDQTAFELVFSVIGNPWHEKLQCCCRCSSQPQAHPPSICSHLLCDHMAT